MSFKRLLFLLLVVPTFLMAGNDKLFQIAPDQYKEGALLEKSDNFAIVHEGLNSVSVKPELPLRAHTFYMRHKRGPKEFFWYVGKVNEENFGKLHAFSIKENHLEPAEVIYMRFYGSKKFKAFQDEADIYFDKEYIYSSRIATLFFMKNGRWELLKQTDRPSIISIDTSVADLQITSLTKRLKRRVSKIYPTKPGLYAFDFMAPGYLPYVDVVNVQKSEIAAIVPHMVVLGTDSVIPFQTELTVEAINSAESLEDVEVLYDKFSNDIKPVLTLVDTSAFEKKYPQLKTAAELNVATDMPEYVAYVEHYNNRRSESRNLWRSNKLGVVGVLDKVLRTKLDEFQQESLSGTMVPEKIEPIFEAVPGSEEKRISAIRLTFGKEFDRFDVAWVGNAEGIVPDTLYAILDAAASVAAHLTLANNKPVWIYKDGQVVSRHQYRYTKLNLIIDDQTYICKGEFKLPSYIAEQPEVQEWVKQNVAVVEPVATDSVVADSVPVAEPVAAVDSVPAQPAVVSDTAAADSVVAKPAAATDTAAADSVVAEPAAATDTVATDSVVAGPVVADSVPAQPAVVDSVPAQPAPVVKLEEEEIYEDEESVIESKILPNILKDSARGTVALIDSGSFRYKGKVVSMSPFAIHTTEVTQQFYEDVMGRIEDDKRRLDRSTFIDAQKPVHNISWYEAQEFCQAIGGDLPTEAQWEFAGRADNNEGAIWNLDEKPDAGAYAVYRENSYKLLKQDSSAYGPQAVASKKPNAWGLYDMSGNVAEWTKDAYFMFSLIVESSNPTGAWMGSHKVYKGGSWKDKEKYLNLTTRDDEDPRYWSNHIGFRCAFPRSVFEAKK
ncbi:MAG: SUMF1/EgtB/PvdO family nonheme iron enzyme [Fibrobacter sp.]|nr:SUMF1/EgtB/PvdO family nonheme iron enzyme [Fibrobacter sp.]